MGEVTNSGAVEIWTSTVEQVPEPVWPNLLGILSVEERERAARFRFLRHRKEYIAAHVLKRMMLSARCDRPPESWRFSLESAGKPIVEGGVGPHFNLSHCAGLVACGISFEFSLGVDVEALNRDPPYELIQHCFTASERHWLLGLPESKRARGFFSLWTMKEALLKATGEGIGSSLQSFAISFNPLSVSFLAGSLEKPGEWHLYQHAPSEHHLLAWAWKGSSAEVLIRDVKLEEIVIR